MRAQQADLAKLQVLPAKGQAAVREVLPSLDPAGTPAPPDVPRRPPGPVSLNLRLPPDMHHLLRCHALQDSVSLNKLILDAIEAMLKARA